MGNALSALAGPRAAAETQPLRGEAGVPLFLDELEATPAAWSQESKCVLIQRFFGWLPDSTAEKLKQDQKASLYIPRVVIHDITFATSRSQAIVVVQRVYRRYRLMGTWHLVTQKVLEIVRSMRVAQAALAEEEDMLANFRQILSSGFSAQKVSINGALKNIQLQLVRRPEDEECYLTWTPSRKRQPRIDLHDVAEVVPVLKEGNKHAPRLANKVSHRRGLIIVCKSHHRGRVVLQMSSKRERKVLLLGFQRLLEDLNRFAPTMDATGSIRKRLPRRQSAIQFFENDPQRSGSIKDVSGNDDDDDDNEELRGETPVDKQAMDSARELPSPAKLKKCHSTSIARFYETRFDESTSSGDGASLSPVAANENKPAPLTRRSSMSM